MDIELRSVSKSFNGNSVVRKLNLIIKDQSIVCLLGPSGCGKTTTLKIIAGLIVPDKGSILFDGKDVTSLPPEERNTGIVPQNYSLFPHLTVEKNIAFGLEVRNYSKEEIKKRVKELLKLVKLTGFEKRYPRQLSGGQQQKIALSRALAHYSSILLLDEPLASIDLKDRIRLRREIKTIQKKTKATTLYITHDVNEAFAVSDKIAVMENGRIKSYRSTKKPV